MSMNIYRGSVLYIAVFIILAVVLSGILISGNLPASETISSQVSKDIRNRVVAGFPQRVTIRGKTINASAFLPLFYDRRLYRPVWSNDKGLLPSVYSLLKVVRKAHEEGLRPEDYYHIIAIESVLNEIRLNQNKKIPPKAGRLADLDLLLTDLFFMYGCHLLSGKVNPETVEPEWFANRRNVDIVEILENVLAENQIEKELKNLLPPYPGYSLLKDSLKRYREIDSKGGWPAIPAGNKMQKGDSGERVVLLHNRLVLTGDFISQEVKNIYFFDEDIAKAVRRFQERHGLSVDSIVGPATLASLNVPVHERVRQIELNMERWRWLPHDLGQRYILVNIAGFELDLVEKSETMLKMRVVVGKQYRQTPVFSGRMTYLVLNPSWHVPVNIAVKDKLPLILKDAGYLSGENIKIFEKWGTEKKEIDPKTVDWSKVTADNFHYRLVQEPGPSNALGRIKFMFPNSFNVYLHDTPSRELFSKTVRSFSSGCIRIEKPVELAEYLLKDAPEWTAEKIRSVIEKGKEQIILLRNPVPVHVIYWTAWANNDGSINFRDDIYGRDKKLLLALKEKPPSK